MDAIEHAVLKAIAIANNPSHGYDQPGREGQDYDCSSLVCRSLKAAGFEMPYPSFSTRTMGAWLTTHGWVYHKGLAGVQRGDVLWKTGHTAFAESPTRMVEAQCNENRGISGGKPGDQTGWEIVSNQPISKYKWEGYFRYEGEIMTEDDMNRIADKVAERVWNFNQNGVKTRDRLQGIDTLVNSIWGQFTRKDDPTGRGTTATLYERMCYVGKKLDDIMKKM